MFCLYFPLVSTLFYVCTVCFPSKHSAVLFFTFCSMSGLAVLSAAWRNSRHFALLFTDTPLTTEVGILKIFPTLYNLLLFNLIYLCVVFLTTQFCLQTWQWLWLFVWLQCTGHLSSGPELMASVLPRQISPWSFFLWQGIVLFIT